MVTRFSVSVPVEASGAAGSSGGDAAAVAASKACTDSVALLQNVGAALNSQGASACSVDGVAVVVTDPASGGGGGSSADGGSEGAQTAQSSSGGGQSNVAVIAGAAAGGAGLMGVAAFVFVMARKRAASRQGQPGFQGAGESKEGAPEERGPSTLDRMRQALSTSARTYSTLGPQQQPAELQAGGGAHGSASAAVQRGSRSSGTAGSSYETPLVTWTNPLATRDGEQQQAGAGGAGVVWPSLGAQGRAALHHPPPILVGDGGNGDEELEVLELEEGEAKAGRRSLAVSLPGSAAAGDQEQHSAVYRLPLPLMSPTEDHAAGAKVLRDASPSDSPSTVRSSLPAPMPISAWKAPTYRSLASDLRQSAPGAPDPGPAPAPSLQRANTLTPMHQQPQLVSLQSWGRLAPLAPRLSPAARMSDGGAGGGSPQPMQASLGLGLGLGRGLASCNSLPTRRASHAGDVGGGTGSSPVRQPREPAGSPLEHSRSLQSGQAASRLQHAGSLHGSPSPSAHALDQGVPFSPTTLEFLDAGAEKGSSRRGSR